ncbi:MAG TPA: hypothetical protein VKU41_23315 [Polyangiaceae bacterium]|nr:hypothetical protein [Polyangiaceae bacterium]
MIRPSVLAAGVLSLMLTDACDNLSNDDKVIDMARTEANDKSGAPLVKQADEKANGAQAAADEKIVAAQAAFTRLREDYRHTIASNLVELDHKVADLVAQESQSSGRRKSAFDTNLRQIHASRAAFEKDYQSLENTSASTWDDARARLDREWTDLKALVDKA